MRNRDHRGRKGREKLGAQRCTEGEVRHTEKEGELRNRDHIDSQRKEGER